MQMTAERPPKKSLRIYPDVALLWMTDQSARFRSADTVRSYKKNLRLLQQSQPSKALTQFTEQDLVDFIQSGNVAGQTMAQRRSVIMGMYEWAQWKGHVEKNPAVGLRLRLRIKRNPVRTHRWLSLTEVRQLMLATTGTDHVARRDRAVLLCGLLAGLRRFEISGLDWGQVDLYNKTITLVGKGEKLATIACPPQLREAIDVWRGGRAPGPSDPVFCRFRNYADGVAFYDRQVAPEWAHRLGETGIRNVVRDRAKAAGLGRVAPHDLRRTFAGLLEEKGTPIQAISRALRHSSVATTQKYLDGNPRRTIAAAEDFGF